jgi:hypothetical protein
MQDMLSDPADQLKVVQFLESIDIHTVPFVVLAIRQSGNQAILSFDSIANARYAIETKTSLNGMWTTLIASVTGTGQRLDVPVPIDSTTRFLRLVQGP